MILSPTQTINMEITVEGENDGIVEITPYIVFEPKYVYQQLNNISDATHHDYFPSYEKIHFGIKNYLDLPKFRHMDGINTPHISSEQQYLTMYETKRNGNTGVSLMSNPGICLEMNHEEPSDGGMVWTYPDLYDKYNDLSKNFNLISNAIHGDPTIKEEKIKMLIGDEPYELNEDINDIFCIL